MFGRKKEDEMTKSEYYVCSEVEIKYKGKTMEQKIKVYGNDEEGVKEVTYRMSDLDKWG